MNLYKATGVLSKQVQALFAAALLCCSLPAMASADLFLFIEGVQGDSLDTVHADEIDVLAWSWGTSTSPSGNGKNFACNIQDISITKYVDRASPRLLMDQLQGKAYPRAILTVRKAGANPIEYIVIEFFDVRVTSLSTGGSGGEDRVTENVTLNFSSAIYRYTPQRADGSAGVPITSTINGC